MANFSSFVLLGFIVCLMGSSSAQLTTNFYASSCRNLETVVRGKVRSAIRREARVGASILRLFFHDCFVNGCDGSVLLDDTSNFTGERTAAPNNNSLRGFNVIEKIKAAVERACPGVVSCADILAIAARDSVNILGGPTWQVKLGRRDSRTASLIAANNSFPPPTAGLSQLISIFARVGLNTRDMVALSGGHTIGRARCITFRQRIYNDANIDATFARKRQRTCPRANGTGDNNLAPIDFKTRKRFDANYYTNLIKRRGLFHSDQALFNGGSTDSIVRSYSSSARTFINDFAAAMIKMGDISPLTGSDGEIRRMCQRTN